MPEVKMSKATLDEATLDEKSKRGKGDIWLCREKEMKENLATKQKGQLY